MDPSLKPLDESSHVEECLERIGYLTRKLEATNYSLNKSKARVTELFQENAELKDRIKTLTGELNELEKRDFDKQDFMLQYVMNHGAGTMYAVGRVYDMIIKECTTDEEAES